MSDIKLANSRRRAELIKSRKDKISRSYESLSTIELTRAFVWCSDHVRQEKDAGAHHTQKTMRSHHFLPIAEAQPISLINKPLRRLAICATLQGVDVSRAPIHCTHRRRSNDRGPQWAPRTSNVAFIAPTMVPTSGGKSFRHVLRATELCAFRRSELLSRCS